MSDRHEEERRANAEAWEETLKDLEQRRVAARAMGGDERLAKHHGQGKLDARARIDPLLDAGSFRELGTLAGDADTPADAVVIGAGQVEGRPVIVAAEDFTVKAGTIGRASNSKRHRVAELALQDRVPLVMMLDGAGHRPEPGGHEGPVDLLAQFAARSRSP